MITHLTLQRYRNVEMKEFGEILVSWGGVGDSSFDAEKGGEAQDVVPDVAYFQRLLQTLALREKHLYSVRFKQLKPLPTFRPGCVRSARATPRKPHQVSTHRIALLRRNVRDTLEGHVGVHAVWRLHDHFTRTRASSGSRPTVMVASNRVLSRGEGRGICADACLVAIHGVLLLMVVVMVLLVRQLMRVLKRLQVVRVCLVHLRRDRVRLRGEVMTLVHRGGVAHASLFALTQRF